MSIYELPDGFQSMETAPKNTWVNVIDARGNYGRDIYIEGRDIYRFAPKWIGWSPVVPPKKKRRFVVVENAPYGGWGVMFKPNNAYVAYEIQTRESAQAVADIYEQAYEVTP